MKQFTAILLFSIPLIAADVSGMWVGQYPTRGGEVIDVAFQLKQEGDNITGKLYGDYRSTPIVEGKVTGDQVSFVVVTQEQAGNQINETRLRFTGTIKAGEMEVTRSREASRDVANGGVAQFRGGQKLEFKLKRLL